MTVTCPYCKHRMRVKGAHPGKFKPSCDKCLATFLLVISPDLDLPPMVMAIDSERNREKEGSHAGA